MSEINEKNEVVDVNEKAIDIELTDEQLDAILDELDDTDSIEDVEDALFEERIIYMNGAIDSDVAGNVVPLIKYFNIQDDRKGLSKEERMPIKIYVNSEGGEAYEGLGILNSIINSITPVWTYNEGTISYSMALLLFLAGHRRHMGRFSFLLYHELRGASDTKTLAETRVLLEHHIEMQDMMDKFIVERTSIPLKKLRNIRKRNMDWYISYTIAKDYNMFDETL